MCPPPDLVCSRVLSPWQECFNIWVLDNCSRKGFPSAAVAREAVADLFYRMFEGKEEFKAPNGKIYRWENPGCIVPYHMAIDLVRLDFTDPKHVKETFVKGIADNTGAMWYYTLVNLQNQYKGDEKLAATLPKKVMEPEDWPLGPEFEKKNLRNVSMYMLSHENGPTFAASPHYDNPRAVAIHDYLCAQRDKLMNPNKRTCVSRRQGKREAPALQEVTMDTFGNGGRLYMAAAILLAAAAGSARAAAPRRPTVIAAEPRRNLFARGAGDLSGTVPLRQAGGDGRDRGLRPLARLLGFAAVRAGRHPPLRRQNRP